MTRDTVTAAQFACPADPSSFRGPSFWDGLLCVQTVAPSCVLAQAADSEGIEGDLPTTSEKRMTISGRLTSRDHFLKLAGVSTPVENSSLRRSKIPHPKDSRPVPEVRFRFAP